MTAVILSVTLTAAVCMGIWSSAGVDGGEWLLGLCFTRGISWVNGRWLLDTLPGLGLRATPM
jgi:hypothetical protein